MNTCYQGSEEVHVDHHPLVVVGAAVVPAPHYSPLDHGWITAAATWRRCWSRSPRPRPACWPRWPAPPPAPRPGETRTATAPCCCSLCARGNNTVIMPLHVSTNSGLQDGEAGGRHGEVISAVDDPRVAANKDSSSGSRYLHLQYH